MNRLAESFERCSLSGSPSISFEFFPPRTPEMECALWGAIDRKSPPELGSAKFVSYCMREWRKLAPLHRWLIENVRG